MTQEQEQQSVTQAEAEAAKDWQDPWTDQSADPLGDLANLEVIQAAQRLRAERRCKMLLLDMATFGMLAQGLTKIVGLPADAVWWDAHFDPGWNAWMVKIESVSEFPPTSPASMLQIMTPGEAFRIVPTSLLHCMHFSHGGLTWTRNETDGEWAEVKVSEAHYPTVRLDELLKPATANE